MLFIRWSDVVDGQEWLRLALQQVCGWTARNLDSTFDSRVKDSEYKSQVELVQAQTRQDPWLDTAYYKMKMWWATPYYQQYLAFHVLAGWEDRVPRSCEKNDVTPPVKGRKVSEQLLVFESDTGLGVRQTGMYTSELMTRLLRAHMKKLEDEDLVG